MRDHDPDRTLDGTADEAADEAASATGWALAAFESLELPLVHVDRAGRVRHANASARRLLGPSACERGRDFLRGLEADGSPTDPDAPIVAGGRPRQLRPLPLPGGERLWQLEPVEPAAPEAPSPGDVAQLRTQLDLLRRFGRVGLWWRDLDKLQGEWDEQVFKVWNLPPGGAAPALDGLTPLIVDEDRERFVTTFGDSLRVPGWYEMRYRVHRPGAEPAHVHSHWVVQAGDDGRPCRVVGALMDDTESVARALDLQSLSSHLALAEDLAGLGLWWHDLRTDRVHPNRQAAALVGLPMRDDGFTIDEVRARLHPDDWAALESSARDAIAGGRAADVVARCHDGAGGWRLLLMRRGLQRDEQGRPGVLLGVVLDVTEARRHEQEARRADERLQQAMRTAGIGYWAREPDRERAFWNEQMYALHGLLPGQPAPTLKEWLERHLAPEDRARIGRRFRAWLSGDDLALDDEVRIRDASGRVRHLRIHVQQEAPGPDGRPGIQFGIAIDISDRRSADLALHSAQQRVLLAARGAGIGTWDLDLATGHTLWDEQMWHLRGVEPRPEPPTRAQALAFVHPEDRDKVDSRFLDVYRAIDLTSHRFRVVWPDGSVRWIASRSAPIHDADGRVVRRIGVNWDVTVEREAEIERRERVAAERASKAKSEFLARMSHELRTPLNAVLGFAQLLLMPGNDTDPVRRREQLGHILSAGEHLLQLINDVLDLSRVDSGHLKVEPAAVPLAPLADELRTLVEPQRAAMAVTLQVDAGDAVVRADPTRLRQVLLNLLVNAIKYNRPGGDVRLQARRHGERVAIQVSDTGPGMSASQMHHLFQPFNRLGAEATGVEGAGIGLALVKALVERMDGRVSAESRPGHGTQFLVELPAAAAPEPAPRQP